MNRCYAAAAFVLGTSLTIMSWSANSPPGDRRPTTVPTTQPANADVQRLVNQLGDADPAVRESAAAKLKAMGKAVIPALAQASKSDDPELSAAAAGLIRKIEKRIPGPGPANGLRASTMSISVINGKKTVDVKEDGRTVHVEEDAGGIVMSVTGVEDGRPATVEFKAKNAAELKKNEPEAYALYEKWGGMQEMMVGGRVRQFRVGINANQRAQDAANLREIGQRMMELAQQQQAMQEQARAAAAHAQAEAAKAAEIARQRAAELRQENDQQQRELEQRMKQRREAELKR